MTLLAPRTLQVHGCRYVLASPAYETARQEIGELADTAAVDIREHRGATARTEWIERLRQRHQAAAQASQLSAREADSLAAYVQQRIDALPLAADVPAASGIGRHDVRPEAVQRREPAPAWPAVRVRINT